MLHKKDLQFFNIKNFSTKDFFSSKEKVSEHDKTQKNY